MKATLTVWLLNWGSKLNLMPDISSSVFLQVSWCSSCRCWHLHFLQQLLWSGTCRHWCLCFLWWLPWSGRCRCWCLPLPHLLVYFINLMIQGQLQEVNISLLYPTLQKDPFMFPLTSRTDEDIVYLNWQWLLSLPLPLQVWLLFLGGLTRSTLLLDLFNDILCHKISLLQARCWASGGRETNNKRIEEGMFDYSQSIIHIIIEVSQILGLEGK